MSLRIEQGGSELLEAYSRIPSAFLVTSIFEVILIQKGLGGIELVEKPVEPYIKDYDSYIDGPPTAWPQHFDMHNWGVLLIWQFDQPVAGATIARGTAGVNMLEERQDLSVLWDIRVHPEYRGKDYGNLVFDMAAQWARQHGCIEMKIETQNINVPACHFYARQGCVLSSINCYGYRNVPEVRHETMLIWYYKL